MRDTIEALRHDYSKTGETFSRYTDTVHKLAASLACAGDKAALEAAEVRIHAVRLIAGNLAGPGIHGCKTRHTRP